ncbi:hypothetical protein [Calidifontibacillus oryziterrae]|uniref:hypothetical protein n=1 Tax=Calidifontibacillus oryziterrae TaxID=1191699 RepID=UPI0003787516|nr:hypothetical protein [Calidifontibacillus oryziterrae]
MIYMSNVIKTANDIDIVGKGSPPLLQIITVVVMAIICISVWSLVIVQLVIDSPVIQAERAANRIIALEHLTQPNARNDVDTSEFLRERSNEKYIAHHQVEQVDADKQMSIRIEGLTTEELKNISENKIISIDTLLYSLNISNITIE